MPKVTKILGYNKARAWESLGFAHKKRLCQHFDTTSFIYTLKKNNPIPTLSLQAVLTKYHRLHGSPLSPY